MTDRNETTGPEAASKAGRTLRMAQLIRQQAQKVEQETAKLRAMIDDITDDAESAAGSALTQVDDK